MIVGCYTLHLYCDNDEDGDGVHEYNEFPKQYTHEFGSKCRADARKDGWILKEDRTAICPKCSGKAPKP